MRSRQARLVRSKHLVAYWTDGRCLIRNFAEATSVTATELDLAVVQACGKPLTMNELAVACPQVDASQLGRAVDRLVRRRILVDASRARSQAERAMDTLAQWNPEVGLFHMGTKHVWFGDPGPAQKAFLERVGTRRAPPNVKRHPKAAVVTLPVRAPIGQFSEVLLARRTHRRFSAGRVRLADFSQLLALTAGIRHWVPAIPTGRLALRTSPSGGARHPIDCYVLVRRVEGVTRGLYHYASDRHRLERLRHVTSHRSVERYLPGQAWFEGAGAIVFFVARFAKTTFRYPYSRAYRAVLIEAGHLCQTFCLTATWLGLAPFCTIGIDDAAIERDLSLDGISESVVYAAGVGLHTGDRDNMAPTGSRSSTPVENRVFATPRAIKRARSS